MYSCFEVNLHQDAKASLGMQDKTITILHISQIVTIGLDRTATLMHPPLSSPKGCGTHS